MEAAGEPDERVRLTFEFREPLYGEAWDAVLTADQTLKLKQESKTFRDPLEDITAKNEVRLPMRSADPNALDDRWMTRSAFHIVLLFLEGAIVAMPERHTFPEMTQAVRLDLMLVAQFSDHADMPALYSRVIDICGRALVVAGLPWFSITLGERGTKRDEHPPAEPGDERSAKRVRREDLTTRLCHVQGCQKVATGVCSRCETTAFCSDGHFAIAAATHECLGLRIDPGTAMTGKSENVLLNGLLRAADAPIALVQNVAFAILVNAGTGYWNTLVKNDWRLGEWLRECEDTRAKRIERISHSQGNPYHYTTNETRETLELLAPGFVLAANLIRISSQPVSWLINALFPGVSVPSVRDPEKRVWTIFRGERGGLLRTARHLGGVLYRIAFYASGDSIDDAYLLALVLAEFDAPEPSLQGATRSSFYERCGPRCLPLLLAWHNSRGEFFDPRPRNMALVSAAENGLASGIRAVLGWRGPKGEFVDPRPGPDDAQRTSLVARLCNPELKDELLVREPDALRELLAWTRLEGNVRHFFDPRDTNDFMMDHGMVPGTLRILLEWRGPYKEYMNVARVLKPSTVEQLYGDNLRVLLAWRGPAGERYDFMPCHRLVRKLAKRGATEDIQAVLAWHGSGEDDQMDVHYVTRAPAAALKAGHYVTFSMLINWHGPRAEDWVDIRQPATKILQLAGMSAQLDVVTAVLAWKTPIGEKLWSPHVKQMLFLALASESSDVVRLLLAWHGAAPTDGILFEDADVDALMMKTVYQYSVMDVLDKTKKRAHRPDNFKALLDWRGPKNVYLSPCTNRASGDPNGMFLLMHFLNFDAYAHLDLLLQWRGDAADEWCNVSQLDGEFLVKWMLQTKDYAMGGEVGSEALRRRAAALTVLLDWRGPTQANHRRPWFDPRPHCTRPVLLAVARLSKAILQALLMWRGPNNAFVDPRVLLKDDLHDLAEGAYMYLRGWYGPGNEKIPWERFVSTSYKDK